MLPSVNNKENIESPDTIKKPDEYCDSPMTSNSLVSQRKNVDYLAHKRQEKPKKYSHFMKSPVHKRVKSHDLVRETMTETKDFVKKSDTHADVLIEKFQHMDIIAESREKNPKLMYEKPTKNCSIAGISDLLTKESLDDYYLEAIKAKLS